MADLSADWEMVKTSPSELKDYILSEELYWPAEHDQRLTIGNLLLAYKKLQVMAPPARHPELDQYYQDIQGVRDRWRSNWAQKAHKEFSNRMHLWADYLGSLFSNPKEQQDRYSNEVRLRVLLELLQDEILASPADIAHQLNQLDSGLRAFSTQGSFIWEAPLEKVFPREKFWFLYIAFSQPKSRG